MIFRTDKKVNFHCAETAIPDSFFFLKRKTIMMMQGWRLRRTPFLNIWPMEPNFPMCNGLQRKNFTGVCEVFCFYSHSTKTHHHTSSNHMYCSHHVWASIIVLHLLPRPNILTWLHFALHEVFPLVSLVLRFFGYFPFVSCLSGYKIIKTRHHIKERKNPAF